MPKSDYAKAVDAVQAAIRPLLREQGFKARGRTFNCLTEDGLTQVVNFQMGPSDPPGTTYFPGLRENLHGLFTINLGVYVPEVAVHHGGGKAGPWIQDYHCCIRSRLSDPSKPEQDMWWRAKAGNDVLDDVRNNLVHFGFPFLHRFATRDKILAEWSDKSENVMASSPPRIVMAIILAERGLKDKARELLARQVLETRNPGHPDYVRKLAEALAVGSVDD